MAAIDPALGDSWLVAQNPLQKNAICAVKRRSSRSCRPLPVGAAARREHRRRWRKERQRERAHSGASLADDQESLACAPARPGLSEACQRLENVKAMLWRPDETTVGDEILTEMRELLMMHSAYELRTLCAALALPTSGSRTERIDRLFRERLFQMSDYREVMMIMWEGTLVEYLRGKGFPMEKGGEEVSLDAPLPNLGDMWWT